MKIETLSTSLQLFELHRNREYYKMRLQRRRAIQITSLIFLCLSVVLYVLIIYR